MSKAAMGNADDHHLTDEQLLLYSDGELSEGQSDDMRAHIEACWGCRTLLDDLQMVIKGFVHFRNEQLLPMVLPPPRPWRAIGPQLDGMDKSVFSKRLREGLLSLFRRALLTPRYRLVSAALLAFTIVAVWYSTQSVSADELLSRASGAHSEEIRRFATPVVYQKLRVHRKSLTSSHNGSQDTMTFEIWTDMVKPQFRLSADGWSQISGKRQQTFGKAAVPKVPVPDSPAAPLILAELQKVYQTNQMDWKQPLSPASYQAWRSLIGKKYEQVETSTLASGGELMTLKTIPNRPSAVGQIEEADFVLRTKDWHPVAEDLKIKTENGNCFYELTEIAFQVLSLDAIGPYVFSEPTLLPAIISSGTLSRHVLSAPPDYSAEEMEARYRLHRAEADLGEPIEIVHTGSGEIEVRGLVNTWQRKKELLAVLQDIPHVGSKIVSTEDITAVGGAGIGIARSRAPMKLPEALEVVADAKLPIQEQLVKYFSERRLEKGSSEIPSNPETTQNVQQEVQQDIRQFSIQVLAISDAGLARAWALRRLAERYSSDEVSKLKPESKRRLEIVVRDHITALSKLSNSYHALVVPVLVAISGPEPQVQQEITQAEALQSVNWPAFSFSLFGKISSVNQLSDMLFAGASLQLSNDSALAGKTPEGSIVDLLATLSSLEAELPVVEQWVDGVFLSTAN